MPAILRLIDPLSSCIETVRLLQLLSCLGGKSWGNQSYRAIGDLCLWQYGMTAWILRPSKQWSHWMWGQLKNKMFIWKANRISSREGGEIEYVSLDPGILANISVSFTFFIFLNFLTTSFARSSSRSLASFHTSSPQHCGMWSRIIPVDLLSVPVPRI